MSFRPPPWNPRRIEQLESLLTERDSAILGSLEQLRALTTRHIQRLHFPAGHGGLHATVATATRLANRTLLRLESHGFIDRIPRRIGGAARGSAGTTWHLGATGERLLRARRSNPARRRYVTPSSAFLAHTLAIAELAVQVSERAASGAFDLLELHTEPGCWRPFQGHAATIILKPDLFVVLANAEVEAHAFLEIDLATTHLPAVIRKCRTYLRYRQTGLEQANSDVFPAIVWVTPDRDRAAKLRAAIRRDPELPDDLFTICEAADALATLAGFLNPPTPTRKEVSP